MNRVGDPDWGGGGDHGFQVRGLTERFFGGVKFSTPGFFGKENICKHFLGWLDFNKDFLCIQNNLKIRDTVVIVPACA